MTEEGARGKAGEGGKEEEGQGRIPPALGVDFAGTKGTVPALQKVRGRSGPPVHGKTEHRPPRGLPPPPLPGFVRAALVELPFPWRAQQRRRARVRCFRRESAPNKPAVLSKKETNVSDPPTFSAE